MAEQTPSPEERRRLRAVVRGRVQGVNFRQFTAGHARRLGLTGYVRNLPDGASVEVVAEGPLPALNALLEHLHKGPLLARVDRVEVEWGTATGVFPDFRVRG